MFELVLARPHGGRAGSTAQLNAADPRMHIKYSDLKFHIAGFDDDFEGLVDVIADEVGV